MMGQCALRRVLIAAATAPRLAHNGATQSVVDFYRGKIIELLIGGAVWRWLRSRRAHRRKSHRASHPGQSGIVVRNMPAQPR